MSACKACNATVDPLAVFPGGICLACHEKRFFAEVRRNGGRLPRPDFVGAVQLGKRKSGGAASLSNIPGYDKDDENAKATAKPPGTSY